jgi:hypothetical protein
LLTVAAQLESTKEFLEAPAEAYEEVLQALQTLIVEHPGYQLYSWVSL